MWVRRVWVRRVWVPRPPESAQRQPVAGSRSEAQDVCSRSEAQDVELKRWSHREASASCEPDEGEWGFLTYPLHYTRWVGVRSIPASGSGGMDNPTPDYPTRIVMLALVGHVPFHEGDQTLVWPGARPGELTVVEGVGARQTTMDLARSLALPGEYVGVAEGTPLWTYDSSMGQNDDGSLAIVFA